MTLKTISAWTLLTFVCISTSIAQSRFNCEAPQGSTIFHGNDIRTRINTGGDMFWDLDQNLFQVPYTGPETPHALYAASVWLGGFDDAGNLKLAAQTYRRPDEQDFWAGPLTEVGATELTTCRTWDTVWMVNRNTILLHQQDFEDNGVIDSRDNSIFGWPAKGNPFFTEINGFSLPDTVRHFAPFWDGNSNQRYEPHLGEYPLPDGVYEEMIPSLISWCLFQDAGNLHVFSQGLPIRAELQLTTYAFYCVSNPVLNQTLFNSYRITNRGVTPIDSTFFGIWMDPDLGCINDDYFGSYPASDAFFVYNEDNLDGDHDGNCPIGIESVRSYGVNPPVISMTFLNRPMHSLMYINGFDGAPATLRPLTPIGFYRNLTAHWRDGSPLTEGGNGYNIPLTDVVKYAFPDDPNDPTGWSMVTVDLPQLDRKIVASTGNFRLDPGSEITIDLAYSYHRDTALTNLENVSLMYSEVDQVRALYDEAFFSLCQFAIDPCTDDCVYSGDVNHDGIANHLDILDLGLNINKTGPKRLAPLSWSPQPAENWLQLTPEGVDLKHVDCNADGVIDFKKDMQMIEEHYGLTNQYYDPSNNYPLGTQLAFESDMDIVGPNRFKIVNLQLTEFAPDSLYSLAFAIEFDPTYFSTAIMNATDEIVEESDSTVTRVFELPGQFEYVMTGTDLTNRQIRPGNFLRIFLVANNLDFLNGRDTTYLRVKNLKAVLSDGSSVTIGAQDLPVILERISTGIVDVSTSVFQLFPNPTSNKITIRLNDPVQAKYAIFDLNGRKLMAGRFYSEKELSLDLQPGVYYCQISAEGVEEFKKIIVQ